MRVEYKNDVIVCVRKSRAADSGYQTAPDEEGGGRGRGVNAVSVFPPTPKKQEQCTLQWEILACHHIAMAPQQAKENSIKKYIKAWFKTRKKNLNVIIFFTSHIMHFTCISRCLHCTAHSLSSSECKSIMVENKNFKLK